MENNENKENQVNKIANDTTGAQIDETAADGRPTVSPFTVETQTEFTGSRRENDASHSVLEQVSQTVEMESLADVALRNIAKHLTGEELSKWSSINRHFRDYLNQNIFWKRLCDPAVAEYLETTKCQVQPVFTSPEIEGSGLGRICRWKMCFMREVHLWNNWRNSRYIDEKRIQDLPLLYDPTLPLFYGKDFLIAYEHNVIEVWNIKETPFLVCSEHLAPNIPVSTFALDEDKVVVHQNDLVGVFELSTTDQKLLLVHCFYWKLNEKMSFESTFKEFVDKTSKTFCQNGIVLRSDLIGNILVVVDEPFETLHIWNIETGEKVKEEKSPDIKFQAATSISQPPYWSVSVEKAGSQNEYFALVYKMPEFTKVFTSNAYPKLPVQTVISGGKVLVTTGKSIDVYNIKTGHSLSSIQIQGVFEFPVVRNDWFFLRRESTIEIFTSGTNSFQMVQMPNGPLLKVSTFINKKFLACFKRTKPFYYTSPRRPIGEIKGNEVKVLQQSFIKDDGQVLCTNQAVTKVCVEVIPTFSRKEDCFEVAVDRYWTIIEFW